MFKKFTPLIAILIAIFIAGCGSSGKSTVPPPVPPLQPLLTTKSLAANTAGTIVTDNVTVNIPATALAQSSTIVVTAAQTVERPPKSTIGLVGDRAMLTITSSAAPQSQINVTVGNLNRGRFDASQTFYGLVKKTSDGWDSVTTFVEATGDTVVLAVDKTAFAVENGVSKVKATIAKITIVSPIESRGLVEMADDPSGYYKTRVLVMVPGFNNNVGNLTMAATRIVDLHQYRKIYGFSYDWRKVTAVPAKALGLALDSLANQGYEIDLLGHSRGGLICRATLENYSKTRKVLNFYSICTPHEGVAVANIGLLMSALRKDYLNSTNDNDEPFGVLAFDTEAANELFPDCSFLTKLNNPGRIIFAGHVDYHIVGARKFSLTGGDYLAGGDTGQAKNVSLDRITAGSVNRYYLPDNSHGSLLKTAAGLDQLCSTIFNTNYSPLIVSVAPSDVYFSIPENHWYWEINLHNNNFNSIKITDMSIESYNMNGVETNTYWYSPIIQYPDFYPETYLSWGADMYPQEKISISLSTSTDYNNIPYDQLDPADKGATQVVNVRYQDLATKYYYTSRSVFRLLGPAGYPTEPTWRSRTRGIAKNAHQLLPRK